MPLSAATLINNLQKTQKQKQVLYNFGVSQSRVSLVLTVFGLKAFFGNDGGSFISFVLLYIFLVAANLGFR